TLIIAAGSNNTLSVFSPSTGNSSGLGSVFAGMVYTVLAFIGFEASAPLGEEAKNPRRTIPQAVVLSCVLIGLLYPVCYYDVAVHVQGALGIAIAVILGFALSSPLNAFALLGTMVTLIVVVIYILTNLSNLVFYWRERRAELNPIWNVAVPVLGIVIFIPVLLASFGIDFAGLGIVSLTAPANAAPWIDLAWL